MCKHFAMQVRKYLSEFTFFCRLAEMDDLHRAMEDVTKAVKNLIELYCRTYHTDFRFESVTNVVKGNFNNFLF